MAVAHTGKSSLVHSLAALLRNDGGEVLSGSSTLTLQASTLAQLTLLFEQYLLSRPGAQHGFLALASHPADTHSLLELQFLFDVLQKTISLKLIEVPGSRTQSAVKIFPFKSLKILELKRIPPHRLEGLRGVYSQLEVFKCSRSLTSLEELLSLCGGDLSSALPWLDLHTLNFSYNSITCLDASLSLLNVLTSMDLSHNKIQDCAEFLKPLSELKYLNLGYNNLQRAPSLAPSAQAKLHTLILRNNELETINGVEQLSSLQHVDLAYNLLLEHSQLAPLALLHVLSTLILDGNPLFFQRNHRIATVRHLSPRAAHLRLKLDGCTLTSSELSVLPKPGQLIGHSQAPPPVARETERGAEEGSSGAGELSDSMSVGEVAVTRVRRKKARAKVKVRRASISELSDTDHQPRPRTSSQDIVLPHQKDIERMDSFREQLGEDWLRYQHHLEVAPPTNSTPLTASSNGLDLPPDRAPELPEVLEVPPPPAPCSQPRDGAWAGGVEQETEESTLRWSCQSPGETQSTLEGEDGSAPMKKSGDTREEEEEEDLGVDLCPPLLVGVLSSGDEQQEEEEEEESSRSRSQGKEVFLRVKQSLMVEVEVQRGMEIRRLDLDSLSRVEVTQNSWRREGQVESLPGVILHFSVIGRERRRSYVLLDDNPQHALQMLSDMLCGVAELNRQRDVVMAVGRPSGARRLQCLRCCSEFTLQGAVAGALRERPDEEEGSENSTVCPECGGDHVVDLAVQSAPSSSTPMKHARDRESPAHVNSSLNSFSDDLLSRDTNPSSSPIPEYTLNATAVSTSFSASQDPSSLFVTAQESSLQAGQDQVDSWAETHGKEELAGSYCYASTGISMAASGDELSGAEQPDRLSPNGDLDVLAEDYDAVDHRLQLFLDMEVFEEEEEELHSFIKMSTVRFGQLGESPSLLVVSNQRLYFLEMSSSTHNGQLSDRLQKRDSHPITELSYLEVGLCSQTIHMEFEEGGGAYTLLVRDDARCKRFFGRLTGVVRELAPKSSSKLKSISNSRLHPQHHLWPLVCEDETEAEDGHLHFFYLLAFLFQDNSWTPLTVLVTKETLYLLDEDHQWCKSPATLEANESVEPSSGAAIVLESQPISCVSSAKLWPSDACRMDIQLYDETLKEERTWSLRSETPQLTAHLLTCVRNQWETMFGVALATTLHDPATS
ncbi:serine/threonine-protein kinase 11-interacting protein isoform X2 [Gadus morhua]|uniref:Serine/threonine-protein kinase 11-interacting protein n=1 Tax=Gadus morhua TaxID=8049 RepID=A0A8C4ZIE0_GADMO|nr:serine/threonine-protein kinase 11-interacting protein isoform X2 [Gadus morhua]